MLEDIEGKPVITTVILGGYDFTIALKLKLKLKFFPICRVTIHVNVCLQTYHLYPLLSVRNSFSDFIGQVKTPKQI